MNVSKTETSASAPAIGPKPPLLDDRLDRQTRLALAVLVVGGIAAVLDTTVVTIALHDLVIDLHTTVATAQWVTSAYLLALTAVIPVVGWLETRLGGKRLWVAALVVFALGSALCAGGWNPLSLIVFRVLQGLGAGVLMTLMMTLAMRSVRGGATARVTAAMSLPIAIGPIAGPILGGVLLDWADWRWIFLINVPLCAAGIVGALRVLPDDAPSAGAARPRLDVVGLALLAPGLGVIVYGLSRVGDGNAAGGSALTTALVAGGVLLIGGFVLWAMRSGTSALVDVTLFLRRSVGSASLMMFLVGMVLYGSMFLLPLFWQLERGETVLAAAILLIPQGLGSLGTKLFIARWVNRFGASIVCFVSFLVIAVATAPFALAGEHTSNWWLGTVLFVRGLGLGAVMVPIVTSAYVGLTPSEVPHASMQTRALQQLGGAFGVALGAVLLQALAGHGAISEFHWAFWVFTALAVVASVGSFTLPVAERPVRN